MAGSDARCKSCARPIYWAVVEGSSKRIPLIREDGAHEPKAFDPAESTIGRIQEALRVVGLFDEVGAQPVEITVRVLGEGDDVDAQLPVWRSHFADCPQSAEWRKGRR